MAATGARLLHPQGPIIGPAGGSDPAPFRLPPPGVPPLAKFSATNGLTVVVPLDEGGPDVTDGYGGWDLTERPRRKPLTHWGGNPPYRMTVPLLFEGFAQDRSVEPQIRALEAMARVDGGDSQPPKLRVTLPASSPRTPSVVWVIETLEWGDAERRSDGQRTRQHATVTLLQFVEDELVRASPSKKRRKKRKHKKRKHLTDTGGR